VAVDLASEHKTAHNGKLYSLLVHDRQCTRIAETNLAYVGIGLASCFKKAAAEHFSVGFKLDVSLQTYSIFKFHIEIL
jgi:hypothetical protein